MGPYYNIANAKPDKESTFHEKKTQTIKAKNLGCNKAGCRITLINDAKLKASSGGFFLDPGADSKEQNKLMKLTLL